MKYKATVRFSQFAPGEIVEIPEDNDLPESFFTQGYLVPLEKPKKTNIKKEAPKPKVEDKAAPTPFTTSPTTTSTNGTKPDKLD